MELRITPGKEQMEMEEHLYFLHQIYYFFLQPLVDFILKFLKEKNPTIKKDCILRYKIDAVKFLSFFLKKNVSNNHRKM